MTLLSAKTAAFGAAFLMSATGAHAATVGPFTFNNNAFADAAEIVSGTPGAGSVSFIADGDLSTAFNLETAVVEFKFTDNILVNGVGDDLVIFAGSNNNVIRLKTDPADLGNGGSLTFIAAGSAGNTSGFNLAAYTFDLDDFGFAPNAQVTDGLFISRGGVFSTVWDIAALNSADATPVAPPTNPIPLPAAAWMLLAGLASIGAAAHKKR